MTKGMLEDKVIVITGGTKGMGKALAIAAAAQGAKVVVTGRNQADGEEIASRIASDNGQAIFIAGDITNIGVCKQVFDRAGEQFGKIDGLVNYAGILPVGSLTDTDEQLFDRVFDINIKAAFFCSQYAIKSMLNTGGGCIINIGSLHAYNGEEDRAAYACSKGALLTLTKHIAKNYAKYRIRANWITMGWVATPGELDLRARDGLGREWLEQKGREVMPMGRLQTVDDHVPGILYLLSDQASQVTGTELHVSGGFYL